MHIRKCINAYINTVIYTLHTYIVHAHISTYTYIHTYVYCIIKLLINSFFFSQEDSLPTGRWNTSGCYYEISDNNIVTCRCNHLTHFAILLSPGAQVCTYKLYYIIYTHVHTLYFKYA